MDINQKPPMHESLSARDSKSPRIKYDNTFDAEVVFGLGFDFNGYLKWKYKLGGDLNVPTQIQPKFLP